MTLIETQCFELALDCFAIASVGKSIPQEPLRFQGVFLPNSEIPRSWG